jgi:5-formyltetrahydrofolate cyclo-ligase
MKKQELRILYKQKRQAISSKEKLKLDDLLLIQFQKLSFENIYFLFTYWPMLHTAEPNTLLFTRYLSHMIPGLHIAYPVTNFNDTTMEAVLINEETEYHTNSFGITEPTEGEIVKPALIDLVFTPMIVCDKDGFRVGYGKGYYDRYLQRCREDILKIGFSYFDPIDKIEDKDQFDVPLNYCVTPQNVYQMQ